VVEDVLAVGRQYVVDTMDQSSFGGCRPEQKRSVGSINHHFP